MKFQRYSSVYCVIIGFLISIATTVHAQEIDHVDFCNTQHHENYEIKSLLTIPEIRVTNPILLDSLKSYCQLSDSLHYDSIDENGNYFVMKLGYRPDDSAHLYILTISCETSNLYNDLVTGLKMTNTFAPDGYRNYLYGSFVYCDRRVVVCTNQIVPERELSGLFEKTGKELRFVIFDTEHKGDSNSLPWSQYYAFPLMSMSSYKSPDWHKE